LSAVRHASVILQDIELHLNDIMILIPITLFPIAILPISPHQPSTGIVYEVHRICYNTFPPTPSPQRPDHRTQPPIQQHWHNNSNQHSLPRHPSISLTIAPIFLYISPPIIHNAPIRNSPKRPMQHKHQNNPTNHPEPPCFRFPRRPRPSS
jgi:hypothetical protein